MKLTTEQAMSVWVHMFIIYCQPSQGERRQARALSIMNRLERLYPLIKPVRFGQR